MACTMNMVEQPDFRIAWECGYCNSLHKASRTLENSDACPSCGETILQWVSLWDENGDYIT